MVLGIVRLFYQALSLKAFKRKFITVMLLFFIARPSAGIVPPALSTSRTNGGVSNYFRVLFQKVMDLKHLCGLYGQCICLKQDIMQH